MLRNQNASSLNARIQAKARASLSSQKLIPELETLIHTHPATDADILNYTTPIYIAGEDKDGNRIVVVLSYRIPDSVPKPAFLGYFCTVIRHIVWNLSLHTVIVYLFFLFFRLHYHL